MSSLEVRDVTVAFGATVVLDHVSLTLADGEIVALLGPSGSGKTTLLRVIAGLVTAGQGSVLIGGRDVTGVPTHRRGVGMVFQDDQLFPHLSTADNVAFGARMAGVDRATRGRLASTWLERVGLAGFERRAVTGLSGGEAKRVALARTLAADPDVLLLDEPLTGLDRALHDRLADDLAAVLRASATTTLIVTHDEDEAQRIADRVVRLAELASVPPPAP